MTAVRFTVAHGRSTPQVGDALAAPVEGGAEWLYLGVFTATTVVPAGIEVTLRFLSELTDVTLVDDDPLQEHDFLGARADCDVCGEGRLYYLHPRDPGDDPEPSATLVP